MLNIPGTNDNFPNALNLLDLENSANRTSPPVIPDPVTTIMSFQNE